MRNVILTLFSALILLNGSIASAQIVTKNNNKDSAVGYWTPGLTNVANPIKSGSATPVELRWNVDTYNFGTGWTLNGSGICDNVLCRDSNTFLTKVVEHSAPYDTSFGDFHVQFASNNPPTGSSAYVRVLLRDNATFAQRTLTFVAYKNPAAVPVSISSSDDVVLYPNPARDAINVIYDSKAGVKTIAIYNLIGKLMGPIYKPADNSSAKINLDEMPNGIYFLRLMDDQGHVLATRRFTRQ